MTTTYIKRVLANTGEGITADDFNNAQKFIQSQLYDYTLASKMQFYFGAGDGLEELSDAAIYSLGTSCMALPNSMSVGCREGVILQATSSKIWCEDITGDSPLVYAYPVSATELNETFSTSGLTAGNERWDIVCATIGETNFDAQTRSFKDAVTGIVTSQSFYKQTGTYITVTTVAGTQATIGTATEPSTPANYAKVYAARVEYGASSLATTDVRDYRYPLGYRTLPVWSPQFQIPAASPWTLVPPTLAVSSNPSQTVYIPFCGPRFARIANFVLRGSIASGGTASFGYLTLPADYSTAATFTEQVDMSSTFVNHGAVDTSYSFSETTSAPYWGNGLTCCSPYSHSTVACVRLVSGAALDYVRYAEWGYLGD